MQPFEASGDASPAPSEETVEAALSAYHEESERLRELPGEDDDLC